MCLCEQPARRVELWIAISAFLYSAKVILPWSVMCTLSMPRAWEPCPGNMKAIGPVGAAEEVAAGVACAEDVAAGVACASWARFWRRFSLASLRSAASFVRLTSSASAAILCSQGKVRTARNKHRACCTVFALSQRLL